ncbi:MAG: TrkA family potassium uptake protein [Epsilonproteobacteria bacterium]|nr:TrkA family potassium uptake protein [Campylobacterota bacterium]
MLNLRKKDKSILIFGYGSIGKKVYERLSQEYEDILILENNLENIKKAKRDNIDRIKFIDIMKESEIEKLEIEKKIIFCAMNDMAMNIFLVLAIRSINKDVTVISVSTSLENSKKLKFVGATKVIDIYEASAHRVVDIVLRPAVTHVLDEIIYYSKDFKIEEVELPPNAPINGKYVEDIDFEEFNLKLLGILDRELSDNFIFVTRGINHKFDAGDILVLLGRKKDLNRFIKYLYGIKEE